MYNVEGDIISDELELMYDHACCICNVLILFGVIVFYSID